MLQRLVIKNFAIIDHVEIDFNENMTVLTGETGAGKSIIIDAIGQLLGQRASTSMVQTNYDKAFIEGIFTTDHLSLLEEELQEAGFEMEDELVVSKEIHRDGKTICRLNYRVVSNALLKKIIPLLIDIHSQFNNQDLLNDKKHIVFLDQYANLNLHLLKEEYQETYSLYIQKRNEYHRLLNEELDVEQIEYYQAQIDEINQANLHEGELEELEAEKKRMQNFEKIHDKIEQISYNMDQVGTISSLQSVSKTLEQLASLDDQFLKTYETHMDLYYQIVDNYDEVMRLSRYLNYDERRIDEIQERIFLINKLYRKYGFSLERVLDAKEKMLEKIQLIENRDEFLLQAKKEVDLLEAKAIKLAKEIHDIRKEASYSLEKEIMSHLKDLYMPNCVFKIKIEQVSLNKDGMDQVNFFISTNKGQDLQPLSKIASGGEMSRIMLAIKCIALHTTTIKTIIFDEVDTGVSGKVASAIGSKMALLATNVQVLCVTHLPQVASYASNHLFVSKSDSQTKTSTHVQYLNKDERVYEIAKMLSDDLVSQEAIENAKILLKKNV